MGYNISKPRLSQKKDNRIKPKRLNNPRSSKQAKTVKLSGNKTAAPAYKTCPMASALFGLPSNWPSTA